MKWSINLKKNYTVKFYHASVLRTIHWSKKKCSGTQLVSLDVLMYNIHKVTCVCGLKKKKNQKWWPMIQLSAKVEYRGLKKLEAIIQPSIMRII